MTFVGSWTCQHNGCLKHANSALSKEVEHPCCGHCPSGEACLDAAWGHAPHFPHAYVPHLDVSRGYIAKGQAPSVCGVCKQGPH